MPTTTSPTKIPTDDLPDRTGPGAEAKKASQERETVAALRKAAAKADKKRLEQRAEAEKAALATEQERLRAEFYARRGQAPPPKPSEE